MVGQHFGRLIVTKLSHKVLRKGRLNSYLIYWKCNCECGSSITVSSKSLKNGTTKSCGCLRKEVTRARATTHGNTAGDMFTGAYSSWAAAKTRVSNPKSVHYHLYGGRGISMCTRWFNSFTMFLNDMGPRPKGLTLERLDVNGDYEPGNCCWATWKQQQNNRRNNICA